MLAIDAWKCICESPVYEVHQLQVISRGAACTAGYVCVYRHYSSSKCNPAKPCTQNDRAVEGSRACSAGPPQTAS